MNRNKTKNKVPLSKMMNKYKYHPMILYRNKKKRKMKGIEGFPNPKE